MIISKSCMDNTVNQVALLTGSAKLAATVGFAGPAPRPASPKKQNGKTGLLELRAKLALSERMKDRRI